MIFVTVGTGPSFSRLIDEVERLALSGVFGDSKILLQSGDYALQSARCEVVPYMDRDRFDAALREAELIISHGGSTLIAAVKLGKPVVACPRLARYGEVINDHQLHFIQALAARDWVIPAYSERDLKIAVEKVLSTDWKPPAMQRQGIHDMVGEKIEKYLG